MKAIILPWEEYTPEIHENTFVAPGAVLVGRVKLGEEASVFYNSTLRADINHVHVGARTNVQDNCCFHVADNYGVEVGEDCTIGHNVVLHACKIGRNCLIGMSATVMDGAEIGENSIVAAGALVPPGKKFPPNSLIVGSPAKVKRTLEEEETKSNLKMVAKYIRVWKSHKDILLERV